MSAVWGKNITLSIFGESHGPAIGLVLDGLPAGISLNQDKISYEMARRAPGQGALSTPRLEADIPEILSGVFNGFTTGAPLCMAIRNTNTISKDYTPEILRPGHADFTARMKYKGFADYRGGGHFSGRLTAPLVFAGAICKQLLAEKGVTIGARIAGIGDIREEDCDPAQVCAASEKSFPVHDDALGARMQEAILLAKTQGDSLGGLIECAAVGLPVGVGAPFFRSVESVISGVMFSIPAVKGIEFGTGFGFANKRGSEVSDGLRMKAGEVTFEANHNGGINGGITNGAPLVFRVAVKPTPTISMLQHTIDIGQQIDIDLNAKGRHDPCIVPRAVPVVEAGLALSLLDLMIEV